MYLLHETHEVAGDKEPEHEAVVRDEWMPALASDPGARFLFFLRHAHGTGPSYNVVTLTAIRDGATWGRLAEAVANGPLRPVSERLDALRHDVTAKILSPLPWSPLREIDLEDVPIDGREHESAVFMEDTVWPHEGMLEDYVRAAGDHYSEEIRARAKEGRAIVSIEGAFRTALGSHRRREVILWQRIVRPEALVPLITRELPEELSRPGSWMHDALRLRDRWQSRLLRSASWSPLA